MTLEDFVIDTVIPAFMIITMVFAVGLIIWFLYTTMTGGFSVHGLAVNHTLDEDKLLPYCYKTKIVNPIMNATCWTIFGGPID